MEDCFTWNQGFHDPSYPTLRTRHEGILMQFGDARMVSAQGAFCVMLKVEGVPLHGERIEGQHLMASVACTVPSIPAMGPSTPTMEHVSTSFSSGGSGNRHL